MNDIIREFGEVDFRDPSCEDLDWCQFQPAHNGDREIHLGKTDPRWGCPMVHFFCDGHIERFFITLSHALELT